ncbi:GPP34 family phosphoprotein, partial [Micromonosporaceae bacterium Da 78-11]
MNKHFLGDTAVLLGRSLRHIARSPDTIITTVITPIAMLLLFVYVLGGAIQAGTGSYVNYLLPGILIITIASGISYTAYRLFLDLQGGIFERFTSMPIARAAVLWAHDTGERHINDQALAIGLAGALLVELVLSENVVVGWTFDDFDHQWHERPGQLFIARHGPTGSPLLDAALAAINRIVYAQPRGEHLRIWMQSFAANDLYDRVHAAMVTAGVIRRTIRRRYGGLVKTETYLPVEVAYPTRVRTRVRDAIVFHEPSKYRPPAAPDDDSVALCGLTLALELTEFLYRNQPNREIN